MTNILDPAVPAGAYDEFLPGALQRARAQREWTPAEARCPLSTSATARRRCSTTGHGSGSCPTGPKRCPGPRAS